MVMLWWSCQRGFVGVAIVIVAVGSVVVRVAFVVAVLIDRRRRFCLHCCCLLSPSLAPTAANPAAPPKPAPAAANPATPAANPAVPAALAPATANASSSPLSLMMLLLLLLLPLWGGVAAAAAAAVLLLLLQLLCCCRCCRCCRCCCCCNELRCCIRHAATRSVRRRCGEREDLFKFNAFGSSAMWREGRSFLIPTFLRT
jgi:hypothetical protein